MKRIFFAILLLGMFVSAASAGMVLSGNNLPKITITPAQPIPLYGGTVTCPVSYSCMVPDDAIAAWGSGGYVQFDTTPCGASFGWTVNGQTPTSIPEYCYRQKTMNGQVVNGVPRFPLPTTTTTPVKMIANIPRITLPTTMATQVPIQLGSAVKRVTMVTTISTSATGTQVPLGAMQRSSDLNTVPVIIPGSDKAQPLALAQTPQSQGILQAITSFLFGWMSPGKGSMTANP